MTSKSPVRTCEDVDETALSYAEVKALCAGDPRIKERMELDMEVTKLQVMQANYRSQQYDLEDKLRLYYPQEQQRLEWRVEGIQRDMATLAEHPLPAEGYIGMDLLGQHFDERTLLTMPPEKILEHAWEYITKKNAVSIAYEFGFQEDHARALLKSASPLADMFQVYKVQGCWMNHADIVFEENLLMSFRIAAALRMEFPFKAHTSQEACQHKDETERFIKNHAFSICSGAIKRAIRKHNGKLPFEPKAALDEVLAQINAGWVEVYLAAYIKDDFWGNRYSDDNRKWAETVDTSAIENSEGFFCDSCPPESVDMFTTSFRKEVLGQEKAPKATAPAQHKPQERSDDFEL